MKIVLICNVGNSDLSIPTELLPPDLQTYVQHKKRIPERLRAQLLLDDYDTYARQVDLPLIRKALQHVEHQTERLPDQVILIASDQCLPPETPEDLYNADTIITAQAIKMFLTRKRNLSVDAIEIWPLRDEQSRHNPADYDGVLRSMESYMSDLRQRDLDARYYLEVTGGTPAMTTSLLIAGTKVLGKQAIPIYITQNSEMVYSLNTGRTLLQHTVQEVIFSDLDIYSYASAVHTYDEHRDLFRDHQSEKVQGLTSALLRYAHQRLNLDFRSCQRSLSGQDMADRGRGRYEVSRLYNEVANPTPEWLLREVYYGARIKYEQGEYADFLGRVFRFQEAALRYLAEKIGVQFEGERGKFFSAAWIRSDSALEDKFLKKNFNPDERVVNRIMLDVVVAYVNKQQGDQQSEDARKQLARIAELANLRNQTQIAHGYAVLSRQILADYFALSNKEREQGNHAPEEEADQIVAVLGILYEQVTDQSLGDNPFDEINVQLKRLIQYGTMQPVDSA